MVDSEIVITAKFEGKFSSVLFSLTITNCQFICQVWAKIFLFNNNRASIFYSTFARNVRNLKWTGKETQSLGMKRRVDFGSCKSSRRAILGKEHEFSIYLSFRDILICSNDPFGRPGKKIEKSNLESTILRFFVSLHLRTDQAHTHNQLRG